MGDFIALLQENAIKALVDVRQFPGSRRNPQFSQEQFSASLASAGIKYFHLPELGGRRAARADSINTAWRNEAFRGYADYMMTPEFRAGMERLEEIAKKSPTAIMCAEALWWRCHRGLISDDLKARGWTVWHIMGTKKIELHPFTSASQIVDGKLTYQAAGRAPELPLE